MSVMIPLGKNQRTWDTDDRLLQSFLGLALWEPQEAYQPKFGAGVTAPLTKQNLDSLSRLKFDDESKSVVGDEDGETEEALLTNRKLAWHFGHMVYVKECVKHVLDLGEGRIQVSDFDARLFHNAERGAVTEFTARRVLPLIHAASGLQHPLYVQNVPARILEVSLPSNTFFTRVTEECGLSVYPVTLNDAEHFFHLPEPTLRLIAPQIIWVINHRCLTKSIVTEEKFKAALDEWPPLVHPALRSALYDRMEKSRSYLLSEDVKHLLLGT